MGLSFIERAVVNIQQMHCHISFDLIQGEIHLLLEIAY